MFFVLTTKKKKNDCLNNVELYMGMVLRETNDK